MKKAMFYSILAGALITSALLLAVLAASSPREAEAAAPNALAIDPMTGLPEGALVFHVEDHTCIVLPTGQMECFCPCEECEEVECPECEEPVCEEAICEVQVITDTTHFTRTVPSVPTRPMEDDDTVPELVPTPRPEPEPEPEGKDEVKGNNGLGNGEDPPPPGIEKQGKPENDKPANPGDPQYKGKGSDGQPNEKGKDSSKDKPHDDNGGRQRKGQG